MLKCCICGRSLPNRYAVAGKCEDEGCESVFCVLHWNNGNRRCGSHGWKPDGILAEQPRNAEPQGKAARETSDSKETNAMNEEPVAPAETETSLRERARKAFTREQAVGIVHAAADFATKLGRAATGLVQKIRNANSPETVLASIDSSLEASRAQRAPLMERSEALYREIAAKKKVYATAPAARKRLLEMELKAMLSEYKGLERQLTAFFENENTLNTVRGRVLELMALGMRKIDEKTIDRLTDDIEEAVGESEDIAGAVRDLDKAGRRHESESDQESFENTLAGFEDESAEPASAESAAAAPETDPFPVDPPVRPEAEPADPGA